MKNNRLKRKLIQTIIRKWVKYFLANIIKKEMKPSDYRLIRKELKLRELTTANKNSKFVVSDLMMMLCNSVCNNKIGF